MNASFGFRHFDVKDKSEKESAKLFSVPDFVGDACKAIASRIRGAVAGVQFDDFHKVGRSALNLAERRFLKVKIYGFYFSLPTYSHEILMQPLA